MKAPAKGKAAAGKPKKKRMSPRAAAAYRAEVEAFLYDLRQDFREAPKTYPIPGRLDEFALMRRIGGSGELFREMKALGLVEIVGEFIRPIR